MKYKSEYNTQWQRKFALLPTFVDGGEWKVWLAPYYVRYIVNIYATANSGVAGRWEKVTEQTFKELERHRLWNEANQLSRRDVTEVDEWLGSNYDTLFGGDDHTKKVEVTIYPDTADTIRKLVSEFVSRNESKK